MLEAVIHIDDHGTILSINDAGLEMFGYDESEELAGRNVSILMPEPFRSEHDGYLRRYLQTLERHVLNSRREVVGVKKNGNIFPLELAVNELVDDQGSTFIGVIRDLTSQKSAEKELKEAVMAAQSAARAKSEFLANMSHEIRTPLNGVLGLANIGLRDNREEASGLLFERIINSGNHLLDVVNDILDISKIESGMLKIEKRPFELRAVIESVRGFIEPKAEAKGLALSVEVGSSLPDWVMGDSLRLTQILTNLLANAVKFTERGKVELRIVRRGDEIDFIVIDSGIGMSVDQMSRLFRPFEQADSSTTRIYGGSGLGLAISRNLANLMGGDISVDSQPGAGSTFRLRLPLPFVVEPEPSSLSSSVRDIPGERLSGISILAVDDVEINRLVLDDLLKHEGANVEFAVDGRQALEHLEQAGVDSFDVVLMDVQMPVMDGYEATRRIAQMAPGLPVIGLTAHALAEERDKCLAAGMVDHVTKPVKIDALVAAIHRQAKPKTVVAPVAPATEVASVTTEVEAPSTYPGCDDPAIVDLAILARFVGEAKVKKYSVMFLDSIRKGLAEMNVAIEAGEWVKLSNLGHQLKSSSRTLGAVRFGEICQEIELHAQGGEEVEMGMRVGELKVLFLEIEKRMRETAQAK